MLQKINFYHLSLAHELFFILYLVSEESEHNKMDSKNLATIFGRMMEFLSATLTALERESLCEIMIVNFHKLF